MADGSTSAEARAMAITTRGSTTAPTEMSTRDGTATVPIAAIGTAAMRKRCWQAREGDGAARTQLTA